MEHKYTEVYILPKNDSNRLLLGKVSSKKNGSEYSHSYLDSQVTIYILNFQLFSASSEGVFPPPFTHFSISQEKLC